MSAWNANKLAWNACVAELMKRLRFFEHVAWKAAFSSGEEQRS
jgi:hypothetical protein